MAWSCLLGLGPPNSVDVAAATHLSSSKSVPPLVSSLPIPWATPPEPTLAQLHHLSIQRRSLSTLAPLMVSPWLALWATPPKPSLVQLHHPSITSLALLLAPPLLSPWATLPEPVVTLRQSAPADTSTITTSGTGKAFWTIGCHSQEAPFWTSPPPPPKPPPTAIPGRRHCSRRPCFQQGWRSKFKNSQHDILQGRRARYILRPTAAAMLLGEAAVTQPGVGLEAERWATTSTAVNGATPTSSRQGVAAMSCGIHQAFVTEEIRDVPWWWSSPYSAAFQSSRSASATFQHNQEQRRRCFQRWRLVQHEQRWCPKRLELRQQRRDLEEWRRCRRYPEGRQRG